MAKTKTKKRLIDSNKEINFKNWITQHNPKLEWDFNDPVSLREQLVETLKESGDIDLYTLFSVFFESSDPDLEDEQVEKFLEENY